ncbi:DUF4113 domain-containing protein [Halomonas sp. PA5]
MKCLARWRSRMQLNGKATVCTYAGLHRAQGAAWHLRSNARTSRYTTTRWDELPIVRMR